jgi:hypothetical protein
MSIDNATCRQAFQAETKFTDGFIGFLARGAVAGVTDRKAYHTLYRLTVANMVDAASPIITVHNLHTSSFHEPAESTTQAIKPSSTSAAERSARCTVGAGTNRNQRC